MIPPPVYHGGTLRTPMGRRDQTSLNAARGSAVGGAKQVVGMIPPPVYHGGTPRTPMGRRDQTSLNAARGPADGGAKQVVGMIPPPAGQGDTMRKPLAGALTALVLEQFFPVASATAGPPSPPACQTEERGGPADPGRWWDEYRMG